MNNKTHLPASSDSNWIIIFTILFFLLILSISTNAQSMSKKTTFTSEITSDYIVKEFSAKEINNAIYFKFLVLENREDVNYTLESSSNGVDFYPVKLKEGFKSPNNYPLLYCYSIDLTILSDKTFRIKMDSKESINYSSVIELKNMIDQNLSAQKN